MTELQQATRIVGSLPPNVLQQFPSGRWGFCGSVHPSLRFEMSDGSPPTDEALNVARQCGPGFARHLGLGSRTWATAEDAEAAADKLGQTVTT